jgi:rare lipoprotein A
MRFGSVFCLSMTLALSVSAHAATSRLRGMTESRIAQTGTASWYGPREAGHRMANGAVFDPTVISAAHRTLPLGSCVLVTRLRNHLSLVVPILDRGPYVGDRVIDLSQAAAAVLGMERIGLARVSVRTTPCSSLPASSRAHLLPLIQHGENS